MDWRYVLYGAMLMSLYLGVKIILWYSWDTHLVALVLTWLAAGFFIRRFRANENQQSK